MPFSGFSVWGHKRKEERRIARDQLGCLNISLNEIEPSESGIRQEEEKDKKKNNLSEGRRHPLENRINSRRE